MDVAISSTAWGFLLKVQVWGAMKHFTEFQGEAFSVDSMSYIVIVSFQGCMPFLSNGQRFGLITELVPAEWILVLTFNILMLNIKSMLDCWVLKF